MSEYWLSLKSLASNVELEQFNVGLYHADLFLTSLYKNHSIEKENAVYGVPGTIAARNKE